MQKQSGFSMVELMIALTVLAVMAAVGIPNYLNWLPDIRLKGAARNLKSDLMLAQQRSIRANASVVFAFNPGTNSYTIFVDNGAGGGTANDWIRNGAEELVKTETMPATVGMDLAAFGLGADQRVRFDGRGLPDDAGEVRFSNTKNLMRRISLSITGKAAIEISTNGGGSWSYAD